MLIDCLCIIHPPLTLPSFLTVQRGTHFETSHRLQTENHCALFNSKSSRISYFANWMFFQTYFTSPKCLLCFPPEEGGISVVLGFPLLWRYMAMATLRKEKRLIGVDYIFRSSVHYHHGREHGNMQADIMLAISWYAGNRKWCHILGSVLHIYQTPKLAFTVTRCLQQGHAYSNKATLSSSQSLWRPFSFKLPNLTPWVPKADRHIVMQTCIQPNFKSPHGL